MFHLATTVLCTLCSEFQSQGRLMLENLALRHQVILLNRSVVKPQLRNSDRLFWIWLLQRCCPDLAAGACDSSAPHCPQMASAGFSTVLSWKSRRHAGRPCLDAELMTLYYVVKVVALSVPKPVIERLLREARLVSDWPGRVLTAFSFKRPSTATLSPSSSCPSAGLQTVRSLKLTPLSN
jgi:hypothetical protein